MEVYLKSLRKISTNICRGKMEWVIYTVMAYLLDKTK